ncbi:MAG: type IV pilin-like G/H family protein [Oscillatoria sp. PMC 1051.18]|nr:type IV pilin-like G/H family protein [Oscillatoria sp. PMC 1050.18]MEC5029700.1 type IV pilin-like G/H family protein [Oscillatoria sp. PMC 1051.18]
MQEASEATTYRTLLAQKQGKGFSEFQVTEILQQVLPQLSQLHNQGRVHGKISLDTLAQKGNQVILLASPTLGNGSISQDIYDLGAVAIALLTGKSFPDNNLNWDDYCVVSDRFVQVINWAVASLPENRFASAAAFLSTLNSLNSREIILPSTTVSTPIESTVVSPPQKAKFSLKFCFYLVLGFSIPVWVAISIAPFFTSSTKAKESIAKQTIAIINHTQIDKYRNEYSFYPSLAEVPIGEINTDNYEFEVYLIDPDRAIATATAKRKKIRSLTAITFSDGSVVRSEICITNEPSLAPPRIPDLSGNIIQCPPGSSPLSGNSSSQVPIIKPDPDRFVIEHYDLLMQREYETTWNNLTPEFQVKAGGFSEYANWWNKVNKIEYTNVYTVSRSNEQAIVNAQLKYYLKNGRVYRDTKTQIYVQWNQNNRHWQFKNKLEPN